MTVCNTERHGDTGTAPYPSSGSVQGDDPVFKAGEVRGIILDS